MLNLYSKFLQSPYSQGITEEQLVFFKSFLNGNSTFLSGGGGVGKSFCLKRLFEFCNENGILISKTSSTGVSALNIGGSTIHSWAGMGTGEGDIELIKRFALGNKRAKARVKAAKYLLIDECSMLSGEFMDKLDQVLQFVRFSNKPFGGIQVCITGDFSQLPPVRSSQYAFESEVWGKAKLTNVILNTTIRQDATSDFARALNRIRFGDKSDLDIFYSRVVKTPPKNTITVFCKNVDVDAFNKRELDKINSPSKIFKATDTGDERNLEMLNKNCLAPKILELKVGAKVMLLKNIDVEIGLVNGSIGIVTSLKDSLPEVDFSGVKILVEEDKWEIKEEYLMDGKVKSIVLASTKRMPLKIAFASTIHKVQSMTCDNIYLDLEGCWADGQAYTALSRARTLEGLYLKDFNESCIKANPKCVEFYNSL